MSFYGSDDLPLAFQGCNQGVSTVFYILCIYYVYIGSQCNYIEGIHTITMLKKWYMQQKDVCPLLTTPAEYAGGNLASGHLVVVLLCQYSEQEPVTSTVLIQLKLTLALVEAMENKKKKKRKEKIQTTESLSRRLLRCIQSAIWPWLAWWES